MTIAEAAKFLREHAETRFLAINPETGQNAAVHGFAAALATLAEEVEKLSRQQQP